MERRLKERLIGAAILVALIVWVVPELLSGQKQTVKAVAPWSVLAEPTRTEPTRTVTVNLDTRKTVALEAPASAAETAVTESAPPPAEPTTPVQQLSSAPSEPAAPPVPATAAPAAIENHAALPKSWSVQLGSFASHANAEQLVRSVKAHNSPAYLLTSGAGKSLRYRVRVGPLPDRPAAERMRAKLKGEGHAASVVAP